MVSADYKERFIAKYEQVRNRLEKLVDMCNKWDRGELYFTPTCSREYYGAQAFFTWGEATRLKAIARLNGIELSDKGVKNAKS